MIDSVDNVSSLSLFRRVLEKPVSVNKIDETSNKTETASEADSVDLAVNTHPHSVVLEELRAFQTALKSYRDSGDIRPLKDYYDETGNPALEQLFAMEEAKTQTKTDKKSPKDNLPVLEQLGQTQDKSFDSAAQKIEAMVKQMENLYQVVSIVYRITDYDGIENYVTQATDLLDKSSKMLKKMQAAVENMPDGPQKEAAKQALSGLKTSLKRMVGLAEKIKEKAQLLTMGMKEKPDSYKDFEKAINTAKPLTVDTPQMPIKSDT